MHLHQRNCIYQINTYRCVKIHTDTCHTDGYIQIHSMQAIYRQIHTKTYRYRHYVYSPGAYSPDSVLHTIHTDTYRYIQIHTDTRNKDRYIQYRVILCRYIQIQSTQTDTLHTDTICSLIKSWYSTDTYWYSQYIQMHTDITCLLIKSWYMLILSR